MKNRVSVDKIAYSSPALKDFQLVDTISRPDLSYEFDEISVFRHIPTGRMWWASDSGCSCPIPYEGYSIDTKTLESDMEEIIQERFSVFEDAVLAFCPEGEDHYYKSIPLDEKRAFINKIKEMMNAAG